MLKILALYVTIGLTLADSMTAYTDKYAYWNTTLPDGYETEVHVYEYHYNIKGELLESEKYSETYAEFYGLEEEEETEVTRTYIDDEYENEVEYNSQSNNW